MFITINGPYDKFNQIVASKVFVEIKELYPNMNVFLYKNTNTSELDKPIYYCRGYNPFLRISYILSQMALDIETEEGENKPLEGCVRNYFNIDDRIAIATEWYSSAIIRVLSNIIPYDSKTNLAEVLSTKDQLVAFAFNLVQRFQLFPPDLNIVFIPNEKDMEDDITHRLICRSLTKNQAKQIKECYANYMNLLTNDSRNLFTKNGENYVPVYVLNRSNIAIPNKTRKPTKTLSKRYQAFEKEMINQELNIKSQRQIADDIVNIIKTYVNIVHPSDSTDTQDSEESKIECDFI